ncbi:MAG: heavy metal translocating P-type ATPase metal-binding domain-containing protein, partial [Candidatus Sericytochromatia bacterium]|nr:heavy metal translocating P-type ATPase metal-binding domain-containing protein [Candidatus Tanganyikabacteria bacterium]
MTQGEVVRGPLSGPAHAPPPCFHCGLPATAGIRAELAGRAGPFCCRGCLAVAEAIVAAVGLE